MHTTQLEVGKCYIAFTHDQTTNGLDENIFSLYKHTAKNTAIIETWSRFMPYQDGLYAVELELEESRFLVFDWETSGDEPRKLCGGKSWAEIPQKTYDKWLIECSEYPVLFRMSIGDKFGTFVRLFNGVEVTSSSIDF